ncbi:MAG: hypothetical protein HC767_08325 [Akkermansiaceae bacterium]|nr:hypothetical protein [Akkermansiaceae bacterium]
MALTATATLDAVSTIRDLPVTNLDTIIVRAPLMRNNIMLAVERKADVGMQSGQLMSAAGTAAKRCIIIFNSKRRCASTAQDIGWQHPHLRVSFFHAGMSEGSKNGVLRAAMQSQIDVLCRTVAFGMGINVPIRSVIHWDLPMNLESYGQAVGDGR